MEQTADNKRIKIAGFGRIYTLSNAISLSRAFIGFPIIYLHYTNGHQITWPVLVLIFYAVISDFLDGIIARRRNEISDLGKVLDPIADKIGMGTVFIYTVFIGRVPLEFLIFMVFRDLLIMAGSVWIKKTRGKVPGAIMSGKLSINVVGVYWLVVFFAPWAEGWITGLMWASVIFMSYSLVDYIYRFVRIGKGMEFN